MMKLCSKCGIEKDIERFDYHTKGRDRRHPQCKDCRSKYEAVRYQNNKEAIKARQGPYNYVKDYTRKYKITEEQYKQMQERQHGLCAICQRDKKLVIDHCHSTKKVRGLLCSSCNRGIGSFEDNLAFMQSAIKYLEG
jgi:hypothetical protein